MDDEQMKDAVITYNWYRLTEEYRKGIKEAYRILSDKLKEIPDSGVLQGALAMLEECFGKNNIERNE